MLGSTTYGISTLIRAQKPGTLETEMFEGVKYYNVILTGLEYPNSKDGLPYAVTSAEAIINKSVSFNRKLSEGNMRGENGHPKMQPGMSPIQFRARCHQFYETNEAFHVREVWID